MEEHENLYEKIQEILGGAPGSLKVLEDQIDLDLQMEYYEASRKLKHEFDDDWAFEHTQYLEEPGYSEQVKMDILARLASINQVECFRIIEAFSQGAEGKLKDWSLLALNENRMLLESRLLEENQVFISTGLGGRDSKLRYFVVLLTRVGDEINESQQMVIRNEFDFILKGFDAEVEEVEFSENMASVLLLMPMNHSLNQVFTAAISECNKYGDFLREDFIVTNVKTLSFNEIKSYLEKKGKQD
jgi:hypothetical protein